MTLLARICIDRGLLLYNGHGHISSRSIMWILAIARFLIHVRETELMKALSSTHVFLHRCIPLISNGVDISSVLSLKFVKFEYLVLFKAQRECLSCSRTDKMFAERIGANVNENDRTNCFGSSQHITTESILEGWYHIISSCDEFVGGATRGAHADGRSHARCFR